MTVATLGGLALSGTDEYGVIWSTAKIQGWFGSPASTFSPTQKPRSHGEFVNEMWLRGRDIVLAGRILAPTRTAAYAACDRLNAAAAITGATLQIDGLHATVYRAADVLCDPETNAPSVPWSVQLHAPDPRKYGDLITDYTFLPSSTGGLTVPLTVPFSINETTVTGKIGVTNTGNVVAPVRLRVDGPCTGPIISHESGGKLLTLAEDYVLAAGSWLDFDCENQRVMENGQALRNNYLTDDGWPSFDVGVNTFGFNAAVYDAASKLTFYGYPAQQ